ncbi:unnamed protein product [Parascedosporium putredinis]|uniref:Uncharacterized protein n=1 Tax=Parascedosporium putredinis TaxID=1442378 RepID=A0A9P1MCN2_9PEZI|nr:unnamed protein product [Parascedosporium putredinis]CAI8001965.1 unnamed protein product [Parascedosporium putredinis]
MDDPGWSWPAWKFGMKREDLTTKLHDKYNTFPSSIQDPEAFHHDVFEIIAHPKLVGTEQWQYALQLFRTRSLDSLVRYFSSYLPESYLDHHSSSGNRSHTPLSTASSYADYSSVASATTDPSSIDADDDYYDDHEAYALVPTFLSSDKPHFTDEPEDIVDSIIPATTTSCRPSRIDTHIPMSPESIAEDPDTAASSPVDTTDMHRRPTTTTIHSPKPKRPLTSFATADSADADDALDSNASLSRSSVESITFSGSESGRRNSRDFSLDEEEDDEGFPVTQSPYDMYNEMDGAYDDLVADILPTSEACDILDSETPTPDQKALLLSHLPRPSLLDVVSGPMLALIVTMHASPLLPLLNWRRWSLT